MGIAANQARLMSLTARQSDLELRAQQISSVKMRKSQDSSSQAMAYSSALNLYSAAQALDDTTKYTFNSATGQFDVDPSGTLGSVLKTTHSTNLTTAEATYNTNMVVLSSEEKILDMELTQLNTEHTAIKTEYDAIKTLIGDNTEKSFNVFG